MDRRFSSVVTAQTVVGSIPVATIQSQKCLQVNLVDDSMRDFNDDADASHFEIVPQPVSPPVNAPPARHSVRKLTHEDAVAIYLARLGPKTPRLATRLAAEFGVTAKAVRDLWTLRAWAKSTASSRLLLAHNDYMPPGTPHWSQRARQHA